MTRGSGMACANDAELLEHTHQETRAEFIAYIAKVYDVPMKLIANTKAQTDAHDKVTSVSLKVME